MWQSSSVLISTPSGILFSTVCIAVPRGGRAFLGICGGGVPPGSPNPDPILDQKNCPHLFLDLASKNPFPFSDLA